MLQGDPGAYTDWSTGICACDTAPDGTGGCCLFCKSFWCPSCVYAEIAEFLGTNEGMNHEILGSYINGQGNYYVACCVSSSSIAVQALLCFFPVPCAALLCCFQRTAVRRRYGIPEDACRDHHSGIIDTSNDFCCNCFCWACALAQTRKELAMRGAQPVPSGLIVQPGAMVKPVA